MYRPLHHLIDDLPMTGHRQAAAHWLDLRAAAGNRIPRLRDLDALRFPAALADAWIIDAEPGGRFRFRLAGENIILWYGINPRSRLIDEIFSAAFAAEVGGMAGRLIAARCVAYHSGRHHIPGWPLPVPFWRLGLPLCDDAGDLRHVFGVTCLGQQSEQRVGRTTAQTDTQIEYLYPLEDDAAKA